MSTPKIFDWLRKASRIMSRMADAPLEVRNAYAEANRRFTAYRDQELGFASDELDFGGSFVRIFKEVAIERGIDIQRWLHDDVLHDRSTTPTDPS